MRFEKFVAENEEKRRGAMKKYEAAREQNMLKQKEIDDLTEQLKQLVARWDLKTKTLIQAHHLYCLLSPQFLLLSEITGIVF